MKNYSTGLSTKKRILETAKTLFYRNGYLSTTFAEICKVSNVNPGTFTYHFGSKRKIALNINKEILLHFTDISETLFPTEDELQQVMLSFALDFKFLFQDSPYRRFSAQLSSEALYDDLVEDYIKFVPKAYSITRKNLNEKQSDFFFAAFMGMDSYIKTYIDRHIDTLTFEETITYCFELYYSFISHKELKKRIEKTLQLIQNTKISSDGFAISVEITH
ncbi:MAG: TetR/AcrR family transcriptional regulator [Eubacterium sp.]|nr:TetR/AcrR family transcriptional regulator [Eubacterium sp.]